MHETLKKSTFVTRSKRAVIPKHDKKIRALPRRPSRMEAVSTSSRCEAELADRSDSRHPQSGVFAFFRTSLVLLGIYLIFSFHRSILRCLILLGQGRRVGWDQGDVRLFEDELTRRTDLRNLDGQDHAGKEKLPLCLVDPRVVPRSLDSRVLCLLSTRKIPLFVVLGFSRVDDPHRRSIEDG